MTHFLNVNILSISNISNIHSNLGNKIVSVKIVRAQICVKIR